MTRPQLSRAFDEIHFGASRTLNLRDSFPSPSQARFRADLWLRQMQVTGADPVLIITGRGRGSPGGIAVVKEEILKLLHSLRRQGVVREWVEHTHGSLVVHPARLTDLLTAPRRKREAQGESKGGNEIDVQRDAFSGLEKGTIVVLRDLAQRSLNDLGMRNSQEDLIESEMREKLSTLVRSIPNGPGREAALQAAIIRAIEEFDVKHDG